MVIFNCLDSMDAQCIENLCNSYNQFRLQITRPFFMIIIKKKISPLAEKHPSSLRGFSSLPCLRRIAKRCVRSKRKKLRLGRLASLREKYNLRQQDGFLSPEFLNLLAQINLLSKCLPIPAQSVFPHKKIERFVLSLSNLFLAKSRKQLLSASLLCLSSLCDKPLLGLIHENFQLIQEQLVKVCSPRLSQQSGLRSVIDNWERMADSVILNKLREFISFCMTFGTFEYFGVSKTAADIIFGEFRATPKPKSISSFTFAVLDVIEFTFSRMCCCIEAKSLGPLLHCSDSYLEWFDSCMKIQTWNKCLGHDPSLRGFSDQHFQSCCVDAISKGKEYVKMAKTHKSRREITGILSSIQIIYGDFQTNYLIGTPRSPPASLLISGDPAVGKSTIYNIFINAFGNAHQLPLGHNYVFVRNTFQEFMDGYETDKWAIVIDDAANIKPDCQQGVDPSLAETFIFINTPPVTANMAELSKKGKVAIRPELIVVTTNIPDLNLPKYFECPSAAARRYPWRITPHVLPQYREQKDVNKLYVDTDDIDISSCPDYWEFEIEVVDSQPYVDESGNKVKAVKYNPILPTCDKDMSPNKDHPDRFSLSGALRWFIKMTTNFRDNQKKITKQIAELSKMPFCSHKLPTSICDDCSALKLKEQGYHFFICPWNCDPQLCPHSSDQCPKCGKFCCPENIGYPMDETEICEVCGFCYDGFDCNACLILYPPELREQSELLVGLTAGAFIMFVISRLELIWRRFIQYCISIVVSFIYVAISRKISRGCEILMNKYYYTCDAVVSQVSALPTTVTRNRMSEIGNEIYNHLSTRTVLISGFAAFAASIAAYKAFSKVNNPIMDEQLRYEVPEPFEEKVEANWAPMSKQMKKVSFLPQAVSAKAQGPERFICKIKRSVAYVEFHLPHGRMSGNLLFVGGDIAIMNTHIINAVPDSCPASIVFDSSLTHLSLNSTFVFNKQLVIKTIGDITCIKLENFGNWQNLIPYMPTSDVEGIMKCLSLYRDKNGLMHEVPIENVKIAKVENSGKLHTTYLGKINSRYEFHEDYVTEDRNTRDGHCGAPLINLSGHGFTVLGIHQFGGTQSIAAASMLRNEFFLDIPDSVITIGNLDLGELREQSENIETNTAPITLIPKLRSRDPILFRNGGLGKVYGSLSSGTTRMKTRVQPTLMAPFWKIRGHKTDFVPPVFSNKSFHYALDDITDPTMLISCPEVRHVSSIIIKKFFANVPKDERGLIQLYDLDSVVNGVCGVSAVNKINFKTSMGFPSKKPKKKFFKQQIDGNYEIPDSFRSEVSRILSNASQGIRSNPIFTTCQKDEARKLAKVIKGNIRLFTSCPAPFVAAMRQTFGSLVRVIHRNPLSFYCAFGVNAHSRDWDKVAQFLLQHPLYFDGDHEKFDKKMLCSLVKIAIESLGEFMIMCIREKQSMSEDEIKTLRLTILTLAYDTAFAYYDFNGTLMQFLKSHASGEYLTTVVNNFVNLVYITMAYRRCVPTDPNLEEFFELVHPITYGDDFALSVHERLSDSFNFETCQAAMSTFGVKITPATKDKEGKKFCLFTELEFLKRKFVWCHELQRWTGPLDKSSISKSLLIGLYEGNIPREQQCVEIMRSALFEMFFHGKNQFDRFRKQIFDCVDAYALDDYFKAKTFPTYENLLERYKDKSYVDIFEVDMDEPEFYQLRLQ